MIKVNRDACIGCGACAANAEDIFEIDDSGVSVLKKDNLNDEELNLAKETIDICPTGAIEEVEDVKE